MVINMNKMVQHELEAAMHTLYLACAQCLVQPTVYMFSTVSILTASWSMLHRKRKGTNSTWLKTRQISTGDATKSSW